MMGYSLGKSLWMYNLQGVASSAVYAFSTTRLGGVSEGEYATFNCNAYCGDNRNAVIENRKRLYEQLPECPKALIIPHQTHDIVVRTIREDFFQQSEDAQQLSLEGVDSLITDLPGVCICVSTADCISVMIYDARLGVVGIAHAGWRGTVKGIVTALSEAFSTQYESRPQDRFAIIGPGISVDAFEVGDEIYEAFDKAGFPLQSITTRKMKWHIDLWEANRWLLLESGLDVSHIQMSGICTYQQNEIFFSARRQGIASGRILNGMMRIR